MPAMMIWPCAPMLNRPARKARATPRPAVISGVAMVSVSMRGANCPATPFPRGLKTAPWKRATYESVAADQTAMRKSLGRAKR
ncbi:hypothetical protein SRABI128_06308 [Microbacterium sp. Bi128]|nr:hypothetical protein SRABI128_06308 [Microbacterium sp. Bi128]